MCVVLLPLLVSVIPVRLADIPSLAPFAGALLVAVRTATRTWDARARRRRYAFAGLLCAVAVLVNRVRPKADEASGTATAPANSEARDETPRFG